MTKARISILTVHKLTAAGSDSIPDILTKNPNLLRKSDIKTSQTFHVVFQTHTNIL